MISAETLDTLQDLKLTLDEQNYLVARVLQALRESMYANRMLVAPRRINEVAKEEVGSLVHFLERHEQDRVRERGINLAEEGLGQRAIVNMASMLRLGCLNLAQDRDDLVRIADVAEEYTRALLEGYCAGYEEALRREQQRTHEAYVRSISSH